MLCRDFTLVKHFDGGYYAAPLCCRSWGCDYCRPDRKRRVVKQAANGNPNTLITLTVNPSWGSSPNMRARELVTAWRAFVAAITDTGQIHELPYFAVFEATKKGEPHLHILTRSKWIDQKELSSFMHFWMNAPIVDIRRCNSRRSAARYVTKYIGKQPGKFGTCKRYWQTPNYKETPDEEPTESSLAPGKWEIVERSIDDILRQATRGRLPMQKQGFTWKIETTHPP